MGVKLKKLGGKWYLYVNHKGRRKCKCIGVDKRAADEVRRLVEAKLALGDVAFVSDQTPKDPAFKEYADLWLKDYARVECKKSTADGYESVLEQYLRRPFSKQRLSEITRDQVKNLIGDLIAKDLSRNTVRNVLCVLRGMFNYAIEEGLVISNPASRLGRFTRGARSTENRGTALTSEEVQQFLNASKEVCPEYFPLFLVALRAGLRRGELVALQWGDLQFGNDDTDSNRFFTIRHNYVRREHTTTKSRKPRRVDMSKEVRKVLCVLRDERLLQAFIAGKNDISDEVVFRGPDGGILDPDNLYHRYFLPVLTKAGVRKIRLHDLRHTFGSLLIQSGASIVYVKEQMGHSTIQVTVDTYGHLIPSANVSFIDRLDVVPEKKVEIQPQKHANPAQMAENREKEISPEPIELIGGGEWTRTTDLRIMRPSL